MSESVTAPHKTTPSAPAMRQSSVIDDSGQLEPLPDLVTYAKAYARQNPDVTALWCFGVGFVLGWKLKPW